MKSKQLIFPFILQAFFFAGIFSCENLFAQAPVISLEDSLINTFNKRIAPQVKLFNGVAYLGYFGKQEGNAYLDNNPDFVKGTVTYDGYTFKNVPILFDLVEDKVVSLLYNGYSKYSFLSERLSNFTINGRTFVYIPLGKPEDGGAKKAGFFEVPYEGKIKVLIKRTKSIKELLEIQGITKQFSEGVEYFIMRDHQLYKVNGESAFIRLFENHKEELKKYLKSNKLKFRQDPVKTLVSLASYYEQLSN